MIINQVVKGGGTQPTGTKNITANGVYDVTDFASADVQVPTTVPAHYIEKSVDANGKLINGGTSIINLTGVTNLGDAVLSSAYYKAVLPSNTSIDFSSLTSITGDSALFNAFYDATGITSVDMSNITTISGGSACSSIFRNSSITSLDLSSLTTISGASACANMCNNCTSLATVKLDSLTTISGSTSVGNWFYGCSALTSIKLNALTTLSVVMGASSTPPFGNCTHLESIEFGGLKSTTFSNIVTQLRYLFNSSTGSSAPNGCTVHFPSNFDPDNPNKTFDITTLTSYPTFNGSASYIHLAYDLPATES